MAVTARPTGTPESPRRGPRRPAQKRGAATQEEVILGAARIFSTVGYAAASLSMISADSGVSQGSLYFHFRSKEDIARAVISEQHHRSFALVAREIEANGDPVAQLITVSRLLVDQLVDDVVVRAGFRLGMDESALEDVAADFYGQWAEGTALMLQRAVDMGRVQTELPVADLARLLVGFFTGTQAMSRRRTATGTWRCASPRCGISSCEASCRWSSRATCCRSSNGSSGVPSRRVLTKFQSPTRCRHFLPATSCVNPGPVIRSGTEGFVSESMLPRPLRPRR